MTPGNRLHRGTMRTLDVASRAQMLTLLVIGGPRTENLRNPLNFINPSRALIVSVGTPWRICISPWFMLLWRVENPKDFYVSCNRPQSISVLGWHGSVLASPLGSSASWGHHGKVAQPIRIHVAFSLPELTCLQAAMCAPISSQMSHF